MAELDEPVSSSDPKQVKERAQKIKDKDKQEVEDLKAILALPHGQRFIRQLLSDCGEHRSSFHTNNAVMAFNEGTRNVGLKLKALIVRAAPEYLERLLTPEKSTAQSK